MDRDHILLDADISVTDVLLWTKLIAVIYNGNVMGDAYCKERFVIVKEEQVGGRARV